MTVDRDLERTLRAHLSSRADSTVLDGQLERIVARTQAIGQVPAWRAGLRAGLRPTFRLGQAPTARRLLTVAWVVVLLGLLLALVVGLAALGQRPPPLNGRIVFGRFDPALGDTVVWTVDPDGTDLLRVAPEPHEGPHWSADGTRILLGDATVDADGGDRHSYNMDRGGGTALACWDWSPLGDRLLCEGWDDAGSAPHAIYTIRAADGGDLHRLTYPEPLQDGPGECSPDGRRIAFLRSSPGSPTGEVRIADADGANDHRVGTIESSTAPVWAPDGRSVLILSAGQLLGLDLATGATVRYRIAAAPDEPILGGTWSPDGTRLLVRRANADGTDDLWTMRTDGTDLVRVTDDPNKDPFMDWGTHPLVP